MEDSREEQAWESNFSKNTCHKDVNHSISEAKRSLDIISLSLLSSLLTQSITKANTLQELLATEKNHSNKCHVRIQENLLRIWLHSEESVIQTSNPASKKEASTRPSLKIALLTWPPWPCLQWFQKESCELGHCRGFWHEGNGTRRNKEERLEAEHHLPGKLCTQHYIGATVICFQPKNNTFHSNEFPHWIACKSLGDWQGTAEATRVPSQTSPVLLPNKDWVTLIAFFLFFFFGFLTTPTTALKL